jgi:hypothetical protein
MIKIDFEHTYDPLRGEINNQLSIMEFYSPQQNGSPKPIRVSIKPHWDKLLPYVYNLAMGPVKANGEIDDAVRLKHTDSNKVFSTAILFALTFLTEYNEFTIGLDGSNDIRATLYHSMFIANKKNLSEYFIAIGVDWYVKLLRNQVDIERKSDGSPFFKPRPEKFDYTRSRHDLYRYYMFELK